MYQTVLLWGKLRGLLWCGLLVSSSAIITFGNRYIEMEFDSASGNLHRLTDKRSAEDIVAQNLSLSSLDPSSLDLWALTMVGPEGELSINSRGVLSSSISAANEETYRQELLLTWSGVQVTTTAGTTFADIDVSLLISLQDDSAVSEWRLSLSVTALHNPAAPLGLWEASILLPAGLADSSDGELFYPTGFGLTYSKPNGGQAWKISNTYPSGSASIQFMAIGRAVQTSALYMSALDPVGEAKNLDYSSAQVSPSTGSFLRIKTFPENAGVAVPVNASWTAPFSIAVGAVAGVNAGIGRPLWYEAAAIYKKWALSAARWTQEGPLSARKDKFPSWYTENSVWINTHWQCHDIFNETGGDPHFVLPYVSEIAARLKEPSLNLHWYEWQQGPNPAPEARYKFDTHYPDYFPARIDFKEAVAALKAINVSSFPYINGRISDINSVSYEEDNAEQYCTKSTPTRVVDSRNPKPLKPYIETYGSDATFCVTNPFTPYWQHKTADIVESLVFDYGVSGVYIDQIASAGPKLCWDAAHDHSLGNGAYWTEGYNTMMDTISSRLQGTTARPMVTEDNAEPYLHMLQGFLTLNAFKHSLSQSPEGRPGSSHLAGAFPMIYGGYYVGFGAIWSREDFYDHDWWCSRLSSMLVTGSQLGWFSLAGIENDPEDSCGPMGVGDLMLSAEYDDIVEFLQLTARSRAAVVSCMLHGHVLRPVVLNPQPPIFTSSPNGETFDYDSIVPGVWKDAFSENVLIILAAATKTDYNGTLTINFENWEVEMYDAMSVYNIDVEGKQTLLGTVSGPLATWRVQVPGRSIVLLEFVPNISA